MTDNMSYYCEHYIRSMIGGHSRAAFAYLNMLQDEELFRALAIPARDEVRELLGIPYESAFIDQSSGDWGKPTKAMESHPELSRWFQTLYAGLVVSTGKWLSAAPTRQAEMSAKNYQFHCVSNGAVPLNTLHDLTNTLPAGPTNPPGISEDDFKSGAATLGIDVPALKSAAQVVAQVETAGQGFGPDGRPTLRFELHDFQSLTGKQFSKTHPYLSQASLKEGNPYHDGTQEREYSMLYNAMLLKYKGGRATKQAIEAASWGKFQVLGENWKTLGWSSAVQFAQDMFASEANHLKAFVKYIQKNNLTQTLKQHQWAAFATAYNGPKSQVNDYAARLQQAFNSFNPAQPAVLQP